MWAARTSADRRDLEAFRGSQCPGSNIHTALHVLLCKAANKPLPRGRAIA